MFKNLFKKPESIVYGWSGDYLSWAEVVEKTEGYHKEEILNKTKEAGLKVKNGLAVYERDSVLFDKKEYPFSLITFLLHSANLRKRPLHVLDFGGALGSTYYQVREFLGEGVCASWNVVEQAHYVSCGKEHFADDRLMFYENVEACLEDKKIDFVLLSGSVQYLEKPHEFLKQLTSYNFEFLLFDRTAFHYGAGDRLTLQLVPPEIYTASYPSWFFNEENFLKHFSNNYTLIADFDPYVEGEKIMLIDDKPQGYNKGFYFINS